MLRKRLFSNRTNTPARSLWSRPVVNTVTRAICESLEARRLLATFTVDPGHSAAYLQEGDDPGQVIVRLDSPTGMIGHTFLETSGQHVINAGQNADFLFVDQVRPHWKPQAAGGNPEGIKVMSDAGNATLHIDGDLIINDVEYEGLRSFNVFENTFNNQWTVNVFDIETFGDGETVIGDGVSNLLIRTPDVQADAHWPNGNVPGVFVDVDRLRQGVSLTLDTGIATFATINLGDGTDGGFLAEPATVITGNGECIVNVRGGDSTGQNTTALIDFGDREPLGHNKLEIHARGTVSLARAPGSDFHWVTVEDVIVNTNATLRVRDPSTIDNLVVFGFGNAVVQPTAGGAFDTSIAFFEVHRNGDASIEGESMIGTFKIDGEVDFLDTVAPSTVGTFEIFGSQVHESFGVVNIEAGAKVTAQTVLRIGRIGTLNIKVDGTFTLQQRPQPPVPGNTNVLIVGNLFIEKDPTEPMGILDLKDNAMIIRHTGVSPVEDVRQYITFAYDTDPGATTHWITGGVLRDGITSSVAAARSDVGINDVGIGYADANQIFSTINQETMWEGVQVDEKMVLVKYTWYGDADLNGTVNLADFNRLAANFGGTEKVWSQGDFNYDQFINLADFNRLASNFGNTGLGDYTGQVEEYTYEELEEMLEG